MRARQAHRRRAVPPGRLPPTSVSIRARQDGTWSTFGGAIEAGETPWHAAVRETSEEIDGIDVGRGVVTAELEVPCDHGCGWTYTTFAVRLRSPEASGLPTARVASGHAAWETAGLAWVPAEHVSGHPGLHPGLRAAWPALRAAVIPTGRAGSHHPGSG